MVRTKSQKKGDALENAVQLIESIILRTHPATKEAPITIETKKKVTVDGVRHEIDVFVTIDSGKYTSKFIFECKNWEDTIGKDEIIVFSEKIHAVQAQTGYFVAKRYTRDASNQAKKDKRIELLKASAELDQLPTFITTHHMVRKTSSRTDLFPKVVIDNPQDLAGHTNIQEIKVRLGNEELSYQELANRVHKIVKDEVMNHEPTGTLSEGFYPYEKSRTFTFQPDELFIDGLECRELDAHVSWEVEIIRPKIISMFDIHTRGRIVTLKFDNLPDGVVLESSFINID